MCVDPVSMAAIAAVVGAGAKVAQGVSDYQMGNANAKLANMEGKSAWQASLNDAAQISNEGQRFIGSTLSKQAASGVDITTGSAADVSAESARNIELDRLGALYAGRQKRWAKGVEANIYKAQGKASLVNAGLSATSSLLSAGSSSWFGGSPGATSFGKG